MIATKLFIDNSYRMIQWSNENIKKFWDYESLFAERYFGAVSGGAVVDRIGRFLGSNVLDYGCGPGSLIPYLLKRNIHVTALEFSSRSVQLVNQKFNQNRYFKGAYLVDTVLKSGITFDAITVVEVIEHLDEDYLVRTMGNIKALLSKDGHAIFTTPNDEDLAQNMVYCPGCDGIFHRWQHLRSWSQQSLNEFLQSNGFEIVESFTTNFDASQHRMKSFLRESNAILRKLMGRRHPHVKPPNLVSIVRKANP